MGDYWERGKPFHMQVRPSTHYVTTCNGTQTIGEQDCGSNCPILGDHSWLLSLATKGSELLSMKVEKIFYQTIINWYHIDLGEENNTYHEHL